MKFLKFLGWSIVGLALLVGLVYWFLPTIGRILITQGLTNHGFTNVDVNINRPSTRALTIPSLTFRTPAKSAAATFIIDNTKITYSFDSLLNNMVNAVQIEHMKIFWDSSLSESPSAPSQPGQTTQTDSQFDLRSLNADSMLPVLPFQHLRFNHVEISNPLAPPSLQQISLNAKMDALQDGYKGSVHLEGEELPINLLTFSLAQNGRVLFTGTHANAPGDPVFDIKTSVDKSPTVLKLQGTTMLKLHPVIHTIAAAYPIAPEYQSVTGTFSGTWSGTIHEKPTQTDAFIGPLYGDFALNAHMPTWPPLAQDVQLRTQGTFSVEGPAITVVLQPSSSGSVDLSLDSLTPPALATFISHKGVRSFNWNIHQPISVVIPIKENLESIQIPSGQIQITMRNSSEHLGVLLSPRNLLWKPTSGLTGSGELNISATFKPALTPSLNLETLSLEASTSLEKSIDQMVLTLNPSSLLRLSNMKKEAIRIPALEGQFPKALSWTYHTEAQTWKLQTAALTFSLPSLSIQNRQWELGEIFTKNLVVTSTPKRWLVNGETTVTQLRPPIETYNIPLSDWKVQYSVDPTSVAVLFNAQTLEFPIHVGGQIKYNLLKDEGSGTLALYPVQFTPQTLVLSQIIQPWPNPEMEITHGTLSASTDVTFGKNSNEPDQSFHLKRLRGIVDFKEIGGFYTPTIMKGLTTHVEILGDNETLRIPTTPLRIRNIQSAVELTETSLLLATETFPLTSLPKLSITNMKTHLLGGTVSLTDTVINPSATTYELTLNATGLDLGEILALEQQEAVKGTGTLDGTLPLSISGKEITVQQGSIQGRPPGGTLQFEVDEDTANSWAKSQPNLDLVIKTLQNYQYSKLNVGVDYEKNGILKLATQLEGKNPYFKKGVPIHFNLNIEENIPALMKSLSLVKDLENKIEKMMTGEGKALAK